MRCEAQLSSFLSMLGITAATLLPIDVQAADLCTGHKGLQTPRPELSCSHVELGIYPSPDGVLHAVVYPVDISLDATPDMESRIVIRTSKGETLNSKDYSSPRGFNGYYVVNAKWSPDSNSLFTVCRLLVVWPGNFDGRYGREQCTVARRTGLSI
jgi:hypothetical protein